MMRRARASLILAGATAVVVGSVLARERWMPLSSPVAPPSRTWTSFHAQFRQVRDGQVEATGQFFRNRDGSTRREAVPAGARTPFVVIVNVPAGRFYSYSGGRWTAQPLRLRSPRTPPQPWAHAHLVAVPEQAGGMDVVREMTTRGAILLRAPALDLFPIVEQHPDPAMTLEHYDIVKGPLDNALFEPPPGAPVDELPWPYVIQ